MAYFYKTHYKRGSGYIGSVHYTDYGLLIPLQHEVVNTASVIGNYGTTDPAVNPVLYTNTSITPPTRANQVDPLTGAMPSGSGTSRQQLCHKQSRMFHRSLNQPLRMGEPTFGSVTANPRYNSQTTSGNG